MFVCEQFREKQKKGENALNVLFNRTACPDRVQND